jgi:hypothetical protein
MAMLKLIIAPLIRCFYITMMKFRVVCEELMIYTGAVLME